MANRYLIKIMMWLSVIILILTIAFTFWLVWQIRYNPEEQVVKEFFATQACSGNFCKYE